MIDAPRRDRGPVGDILSRAASGVRVVRTSRIAGGRCAGRWFIKQAVCRLLDTAATLPRNVGARTPPATSVMARIARSEIHDAHRRRS
jgi:hypothetical protein